MHAVLTPTERFTLDAWLKKNKVKKLLKNGGRIALVWGPNTGIGVPVTAAVMDQDGKELSLDITDYSSW
jgi:hypothetical protein